MHKILPSHLLLFYILLCCFVVMHEGLFYFRFYCCQLNAISLYFAIVTIFLIFFAFKIHSQILSDGFQIELNELENGSFISLTMVWDNSLDYTFGEAVKFSEKCFQEVCRAFSSFFLFWINSFLCSCPFFCYK